jgi:hypothetical protein
MSNTDCRSWRKTGPTGKIVNGNTRESPSQTCVRALQVTDRCGSFIPTPNQTLSALASVSNHLSWAGGVIVRVDSRELIADS